MSTTASSARLVALYLPLILAFALSASALLRAAPSALFTTLSVSSIAMALLGLALPIQALIFLGVVRPRSETKCSAETAAGAVEAPVRRLGARPFCGVSHRTVARLEMAEFGAGALEGRDATCVVCFEEMGWGERVRVLPCGHVYHAPCVDPWLVRRGRCPTCVAVVPEVAC